jgi:cytochrome b involved in lipid metabolism
MSKTFSVAEIAAHKNKEEGMYIIVDGGIYDITGGLALLCSFVLYWARV